MLLKIKCGPCIIVKSEEKWETLDTQREISEWLKSIVT